MTTSARHWRRIWVPLVPDAEVKVRNCDRRPGGLAVARWTLDRDPIVIFVDASVTRSEERKVQDLLAPYVEEEVCLGNDPSCLHDAALPVEHDTRCAHGAVNDLVAGLTVEVQALLADSEASEASRLARRRDLAVQGIAACEIEGGEVLAVVAATFFDELLASDLELAFATALPSAAGVARRLGASTPEAAAEIRPLYRQMRRLIQPTLCALDPR